MIPTSDEYKAAINAPTRRIVPRAIIDLSDPDLAVTSVVGDINVTYSFPLQLTDKTPDPGAVYASLEPCRWILDGTESIMPDDPSTRTDEQGIMGNTLSGDDGALSQTITMQFTGVETLQMVSVSAPGADVDGFPTDISIVIYSGDIELYRASAMPTKAQYVFTGFTVVQPNKIVLTINSWSLPKRYARLITLLPGLLETWGGDVIYRMQIIQQADFSNLTLPYSSASLEIDNTSKRFDPSEPDSLFLSVIERQPIPLFYGLDLGNSIEYIPCGVYYQQNEGWHIENDGLTICWDLIDIIGLLVDRKYEETAEHEYGENYRGHLVLLPIRKTLTEWIESIINQLDSTFQNHYYIDPSLGNPYFEIAWVDVEDLTCGDLLRYLCQATNSFPMVDPITGYLVIKPIDNTPQQVITLRSQNSLPGSQSNIDIAFLSFALKPLYQMIYVDGEWMLDPLEPEYYETTLYSVPGTEKISDKTVNIKNPFITNTTHAIDAAKVILTQYGGNILNIKCRGDMSREVGDVETVELYPNQMVGSRIQKQELLLENGIMTNVSLEVLQANGGKMYTDVIVITESGSYTMPTGVTEIMLVVVGGGDGGDGGDGATRWYLDAKDNGQGGDGGYGGKIFSIPLTINDGQQFTVEIGQGGVGGDGGVVTNTPNQLEHLGKAGTAGTPTVVTMGGIYSSASGLHMSTGYVDLITNIACGVPGENGLTGQRPSKVGANATPKTGNGGAGGQGGASAVLEFYVDPDYWPGDPNYQRARQLAPPVNGAKGGNGADGLVLIFYTKEEST